MDSFGALAKTVIVMKNVRIVLGLLPALIIIGFLIYRHQRKEAAVAASDTRGEKAVSCESNIPARCQPASSDANIHPVTDSSHKNMVWIAGGTFMMGGDNDQAQPDEYPKHKVMVHGFWMDATEVTNAQFAAFVKATGYVTTAEQKPDWEQLKKDLPPGTPKPDENLLVPASLVFTPPSHPIPLDD